MWLLSNRFMRDQLSENVEWGYSFDVHINAQFPPLIILHFVMLIFYKILFSQEWFIARFLGNSLWLLSCCYYVYITFLGYNCKLTIIVCINFVLINCSIRYTVSQKITNETNFSNHASLFPLLHRDCYNRMEFKYYVNEFLSLSSTVIFNCNINKRKL